MKTKSRKSDGMESEQRDEEHGEENISRSGLLIERMLYLSLRRKFGDDTEDLPRSPTPYKIRCQICQGVFKEEDDLVEIALGKVEFNEEKNRDVVYTNDPMRYHLRCLVATSVIPLIFEDLRGRTHREGDE